MAMRLAIQGYDIKNVDCLRMSRADELHGATAPLFFTSLDSGLNTMYYSHLQ